MKDAFLIGRFLPGYAASFGRRSYPRPEGPAFRRDERAARLAARARKGRRRKTTRRLTSMASLSAALLLLIVLVHLPLRRGGSFEVRAVDQEVISVERIAPTRQQPMRPPPPRPPVPVAVADDVVLEDEPLDLDASLELEAPLAADVTPPPPPVKEAAMREEPAPEVFAVVEVMPQMIGGMVRLAAAVEYPEAAHRAGIEGTVVVRIVVDEEGRPTSPSVLRSPAAVLEEAALEAVMQQRFTPGRQRSRRVKVEMTIPVRFQLARR